MTKPGQAQAHIWCGLSLGLGLASKYARPKPTMSREIDKIIYILIIAHWLECTNDNRRLTVQFPCMAIKAQAKPKPKVKAKIYERVLRGDMIFIGGDLSAFPNPSLQNDARIFNYDFSTFSDPSYTSYVDGNQPQFAYEGAGIPNVNAAAGSSYAPQQVPYWNAEGWTELENLLLQNSSNFDMGYATSSNPAYILLLSVLGPQPLQPSRERVTIYRGTPSVPCSVAMQAPLGQTSSGANTSREPGAGLNARLPRDWREFKAGYRLIPGSKTSDFCVSCDEAVKLGDHPSGHRTSWENHCKHDSRRQMFLDDPICEVTPGVSINPQVENQHFDG
ncbi:hypothetical protein DFP72DRAFT_855895 [Ephemerocybe angulata]|uniref:Uncharacterized protein n=1 Tax=Ephemerocybe angulata TaxID=980116 RepID=A0A8H6HGF6_9AGAR|nr:hypothetical protein DFP72DRAFT_855895 [Tulosesus angulatus]